GNGLKLVMLPKKTRGTAVVALVNLRFGDESTLRGKAATSILTGFLLMRGTKDKTRQQIQDEMNRLKARITVSGNAGAATASIEGMESNLTSSLRLASEMLRHPAFPEDEFVQARNQLIAAVGRIRGEPQLAGELELQRMMKPYARDDVRYNSTPDE